jgi:hypothetical protein
LSSNQSASEDLNTLLWSLLRLNVAAQIPGAEIGDKVAHELEQYAKVNPRAAFPLAKIDKHAKLQPKDMIEMKAYLRTRRRGTAY